jgi:hypothetical protein
MDCRQATPVRNVESVRGGGEQERSNRVVADRTRGSLPTCGITRGKSKRLLYRKKIPVEMLEPLKMAQ